MHLHQTNGAEERALLAWRGGEGREEGLEILSRGRDNTERKPPVLSAGTLWFAAALFQRRWHLMKYLAACPTFTLGHQRIFSLYVPSMKSYVTSSLHDIKRPLHLCICRRQVVSLIIMKCFYIFHMGQLAAARYSIIKVKVSYTNLHLRGLEKCFVLLNCK